MSSFTQHGANVTNRPATTGGMPSDFAPFSMASIDPPAGLQGLALSLIVLSVVLLSYFGDQSAEAMATVSQYVVTLMVVVIVIGRVFAGSLFRLSRDAILAFLFLIWLSVDLLMASENSFALAISSTLYVTQAKIVLVAIVGSLVINGRRAYRMMLWAVILAAIVASMGGLAGILKGDQNVNMGERFAGSFGNANQTGNLFAFAVWAATSLFFGTRRIFWKIVLIALSLGLVASLSRTGSRQAMIALLIIAAAFYWFVVRQVTKSIPAKFTFLVIAALVIASILVYLSTTQHWPRMLGLLGMGSGARGDTLSDNSRAAYLSISFQTFVAHPVTGVGIGGLRIAIARGPGTGLGESPHNTIFALAGAWGLPGWLLYYGMLVAGVFRLHRISKMNILAEDRNMIRAIFGLYLAMAVWSFTTELTVSKHLWVVLLGSAGYVEWVGRTYRPALVNCSPWPPRAASRPIALVADSPEPNPGPPSATTSGSG